MGFQKMASEVRKLPRAILRENQQGQDIKRVSEEFVRILAGLLSNQGEKSINFYFIMVPLRKKVMKCGTPKPS